MTDNSVKLINSKKPYPVGTTGIEPASQVGDEPLVVYRQSSTIELRSVAQGGRTITLAPDDYFKPPRGIF